MISVPIMPIEYIGKTKKTNEYVKSNPREWTPKEIEWILCLRERGYSAYQIAQSVNRSVISVSVKLKRLTKKDYTYNKGHYEEKCKANKEYYELLHPKSILDLYCGKESWWKVNTNADVVSNDINEESKSTFHQKAEKLIHKLYYDDKKYDLVDLDPFGSAYDCFDLAIKMAVKGIIITFGEIGHKRFNRIDFVRRYYGIENISDFNTNNLIAEVRKIALRNKKDIIPVIIKEWNGISRVYFKLQNIKIVEQWKHGRT